MELRQIKELMSSMERSGVTKVVVKREGEFEVQIERQDVGHVITHVPRPDFETYHSPLPVSRAPEPLFAVSHAQSATPPAAIEESGKFVTSPMVGTFYSSPSPDDPAFVKVGDKIEANTVVCIVEAMKVMNEVKAGIAGTVAEVLVSNGNPLEFGTKILRVV